MKQIKLVQSYRSRGLQKLQNIPGYYRNCEEPNCPRYIPCPHVRCQEHRTDFAIKDNTVPSLEPNEVEIVN